MSEDFESSKPAVMPASVDDVVELAAFYNPETGKPWDTKSGGKLSVIAKLPYEWLQKFGQYDESELKFIPQDIRGFRIYEVGRIPKGRIGGTEFHRIRHEIAVCTQGLVEWRCEDVYGKRKNFVLDKEKGVYMPSFIRHTYLTPENGPDGSELIVVCNTLFDANDKRTHDSYPAETFEKLQKHYK